MEVVETATARIPKLGLGTWQNTGEACTQTVQTALDAGYRHIDTAQHYENERAVGRGLAQADVDREEVFLTTKVWRSNLQYQDVIASVTDSLDRLQVEYVDLLLIHWPHPRVPIEETLDAMAELCDRGLVRQIGVSNFTLPQLQTAQETAAVPIVANQVLYHPYTDQSTLQQYCARHDITLIAYSPLARGDVLSDAVLERIGERYDKRPAHVALRWLVQQDGVVAIPKASTPDHLHQNLDVFDFALTAEEMTRISARSGPLRVRLRKRLPALMRHLPI
ncbi:aldo/keto reductase [Halorientalis brevis]|uniref:Aldo/keto reductase n=1 Tax=Halorientalis brevis TaxID=1126241 RepID=A0ABD6CDT1_9EURY|nr:aldo/keto reductase [Halorientalis brevis]